MVKIWTFGEVLAMEKGQKVQQSNLNLKSLFKMQWMGTKTMLILCETGKSKARDTKKSTYCLVVVIERNQWDMNI
jgi:hypothetical protein